MLVCLYTEDALEILQQDGCATVVSRAVAQDTMGHWYELQDELGTGLYAQIVSGPRGKYIQLYECSWNERMLPDECPSPGHVVATWQNNQPNEEKHK